MLMSLDQVIGLSQAYRAVWAQDAEARQGFASLLTERILSRLDDQSRALLKLSVDLSRYVSDPNLSPFLQCETQTAMALLPEDTRNALHEFGYDLAQTDGTGTSSVQESDETLSHYGLRYLSDAQTRKLRHTDIVDAGSYDGASAQFFLKTYSPSCVFCFEPDPVNYQMLRVNTQAERDSGAILDANIALSDHEGLATMQSAGVGTSRAKAELAFEPKIVVETATLDAVMQAHPQANIGLIKLDVEGDAVPVLRGALRTIRAHQPVLIVSFYHTPDEFRDTLPFMIETLPGYEFQVRKVAPNLFKEHAVIALPKTH
ncbi:FkbM family methyltransferase [Marivita sp. S6314]|uniref:FkbM family methyltransferase n=1 Tax=Marivita sp. S6314 TaxID=2926406 RepID=UPI001FF2B0A7|nr:FkbM family methyltransferase [Marivita sp. S6314]MCK0149319.1 FkbM family methyltransferase [Marivita sp. S6314]